MRDQKALTVLLRDAKRVIGYERIRGLLKEPLNVNISDHDTGCQAWIDAFVEGMPRKAVWQGSIWFSPHYEFNDSQKVLGMNPEMAFATAKVEEFFAQVQKLMDEYESNRAVRALKEQADHNTRDHEAIAAYREMLL